MKTLTFEGKWLDEGDLTITITKQQKQQRASLEYNTGRGPFEGDILELGSPVISVDFYDGEQWAAGKQAGLLDHKGDRITWSNGTVWTRIFEK